MLEVIDIERIRRAHYVEGKSLRQISREMKHGYWTIRKALKSAEKQPYQLKEPKPAPKLDPFKTRIEELLKEEAGLPKKHRYTSRKLYEMLCEEGYTGSQSNLRRHVGKRRRELRQTRPAVFIPLQFQPGEDAQVDWGEAHVIMDGEQRKVQLFVMRLCYSRRTFAMAYPTQRQEAFFGAHSAAFDYFGGVPHRVTYDNLKTAVQKVLSGRNRQEQERFVQLRSHYLFESRFCTPAQGHEKGGVEHGVKYVRQNMLTPLVKVGDFSELNRLLRERCEAEDARQVDRQPATIGEMFKQEAGYLRPCPASAYPNYITREVVLNRYCQVVFETNRYSVPADKAVKQLTLHIYPFHLEVWDGQSCLASHRRSYERKQDILDPLHYLPLLAQRPGAFEHAAPLQQWRSQWPPMYEQLRQQLQAEQPQEQATREFIAILQLHLNHPAEQVAAAIEEAVTSHIAHLAGVTFCLHKTGDLTPAVEVLDLSTRPNLAVVGTAPVPATTYNQLLRRIEA